MVCLGNICRSPLAEGILRTKLDSHRFRVDSAGTGGWHVGKTPDPRSIEVGLKNGVNISGLLGRKFTEADFDAFDYIFVMDKHNKQHVLDLATSNEQKHKVRLLLDTVFPREQMDVPDPYHGTVEDFERVYEMLNAACDNIVKEVQ